MKAEHDRAWWVPHHIPVNNGGLFDENVLYHNLSTSRMFQKPTSGSDEFRSCWVCGLSL